MNRQDADNETVMAPSVAQGLTVDRSLLLAAAGRAPFDVAYVLMKQRAVVRGDEGKDGDASSRAALSVTWSLQNQANIRGKWNIV